MRATAGKRESESATPLPVIPAKAGIQPPGTSKAGSRLSPG